MRLTFPSALLAILVLVFSFAVACSKQATDETAAPKGEIIVGYLEDLSGPFSDITRPRMDGLLDCVKYINDGGGIRGHPLRTIVIDHKLDTEQVNSGWVKLKEEGVLLVISMSGSFFPFLQTSCDEDHIPLIAGGGTMNQLYPKEPSYLFCSAPSHLPGVVHCFIDLIEKRWVDGGKNRLPKIGIVAVDARNIPQTMRKATKLYTEQKRWEYTVISTGITPGDVSAQIRHLKEFECDYVYLQGTAQHGIALLKELNKQEYRPSICGATSAIGTRQVWEAVGEQLAGATHYNQGVMWWETNIPLVKLVRDLNAKWYPEVTERDYHYLRSFADFLVVAEAMNRCIDNVGYDNLDGNKMRVSMETIRDFDPGIGVGYTWTPTDHQGLPGGRWFKWTENGAFVNEGGWCFNITLPEEQQTDSWWLKD